MTSPQVPHDPAPSKFHLLLDFLKSRLLTIFAIMVVGALAALYFSVDVSTPRWLRLSIITGVVVFPYGYVVAKYIVGLLLDPDYIYLVDLDARYLDGALYRFPSRQFRDIDVREGSLCQLTPHLYTAKDVDLDDMSCLGTWRGTLDDRDLLRSLSKVHECRDILEQDAKRGFAIEAQAFSIIRQATRSAVMTVVDTFESGTLPDEGDGIATAVDDAIERYDLESRIDESLDDNTDLDLEDIQDIEPNDFDPHDNIESPDADDLIDPTEVSADD